MAQPPGGLLGSGDEGGPPPFGVLLAALVVLFVLGALAGVVSAFLVPAGPLVGHTVLSVGIALAAVVNLALALAGARLTGSRVGAGIPLVGWLTAVLPFTVNRPEGDFLVTSNHSGRFVLYLLVGVLASGVGIAVSRGSHQAGAGPR